MKCLKLIFQTSLIGLVSLSGVSLPCYAADHNDPNAINSIFADLPVSAADLYDMFGFPSDDKTGGEKVVVLTFASIPKTGLNVLDILSKNILAQARTVLPGQSISSAAR